MIFFIFLFFFDCGRLCFLQPLISRYYILVAADIYFVTGILYIFFSTAFIVNNLCFNKSSLMLCGKRVRRNESSIEIMQCGTKLHLLLSN